MERIEPRLIEDETGKVRKFCGLEYCPRGHYARGYCVNHYHQYNRLGYVRPFVDYETIEYGPCSFPDCRNRSTTKLGRQLCSGHINQVTKAHPSYTDGVLRPLHHYINDGYTGNGRVCKVCNEEKPIDEFYDRNGHKGIGKVCKSTKCKECFKKDVSYYQGKRDTKADGTDPLNYRTDPAELARRKEHYTSKRKLNG